MIILITTGVVEPEGDKGRGPQKDQKGNDEIDERTEQKRRPVDDGLQSPPRVKRNRNQPRQNTRNKRRHVAPSQPHRPRQQSSRYPFVIMIMILILILMMMMMILVLILIFLSLDPSPQPGPPPRALEDRAGHQIVPDDDGKHGYRWNQTHAGEGIDRQPGQPWVTPGAHRHGREQVRRAREPVRRRPCEPDRNKHNQGQDVAAPDDRPRGHVRGLFVEPRRDRDDKRVVEEDLADGRGQIGAHHGDREAEQAHRGEARDPRDDHDDQADARRLLQPHVVAQAQKGQREHQDHDQNEPEGDDHVPVEQSPGGG